MTTPTNDTYDFLNTLCTRLNECCFNDELPELLISIRSRGKAFGYYKYRAFVSNGGQVADELAVNPAFFATHGFKELIQTIGHELCHQWQFHFGKPSVRAYHNKEFAAKMKSIGLMPSSTGEPGGKETGQNMADYMAESGPIVELYQSLENEGVMIPWYERVKLNNSPGTIGNDVPNIEISLDELEANMGSTGGKRARYTHQCTEDKKPSVIYGKPGLPLVCGNCNENWIADEA